MSTPPAPTGASEPTAAPAPEPVLLSRTGQVERLAAELRGVGRLAVDTEFHAERRYRPYLLLLQLAAPDGRAWVLDPVSADLSALGPVLAQAEVLVHGGLHDLALLHATLGVWPRAVLDSQRMAALCGSPYPARLDRLVAERLGVAMPHGRALSDWQARPLSAEQLRYASQDVLLLHRLVEVLQGELVALGRLELAREASMELVVEAQEPPRPLDAWRSWRVATELDDGERAVLQAVMEWRDARGQQRDQPPWFLLGDSIALELARSRPRSLDELSSDRRLGSGLRKRFGPELLASIAAALAPGAAVPPPVPPEVAERRALLEAWALAWERRSGVAAGLLLPPALLARVAESGPEALTGWRRAVAGTALDALWSGQSRVGLDGGLATLHVGAAELPVVIEPSRDSP